MKPEHEARRKIIREWMSLPKDKRQTEEQAAAFAMKVMERVPSRGLGYRGATECEEVLGSINLILNVTEEGSWRHPAR